MLMFRRLGCTIAESRGPRIAQHSGFNINDPSTRGIEMNALFDKNEFPAHVFANLALDFSGDLLINPTGDSWFRLACHRLQRSRDSRNIEEEVFRQSLLIPTRSFRTLFPRLESIGNALGSLGTPGGSLSHRSGQKKYRYHAFHQFRFGSVATEPLVFLHENSSCASFFINPDLEMF